MKLVLYRLSLVLLGLCFLAGTLGDAYHLCRMQKPAPQEMAGMDCHKSMTPAKTAKNMDCCQDLSCPYCVAVPVVMTQAQEVQSIGGFVSLKLPAATSLRSLNPLMPERPPKFV